LQLINIIIIIIIYLFTKIATAGSNTFTFAKFKTRNTATFFAKLKECGKNKKSSRKQCM